MEFREELESGVIRLNGKLKRDDTREMANKEHNSIETIFLIADAGTTIEEFAQEFMKLKSEGLNFIANYNGMDFDSSFYSSTETIIEAYTKWLKEKELAEKETSVITEGQNLEASVQSSEFNIKTANYDQLLARRNEIKLALEEALASPVKDNKKIEELRKELADLDKALASIELTEEAVEKEDKKPDEEEKKEEVKDETALNEQEQQEQLAREAELRQAYYDAMVKFYAIRKENAIKLANNKGMLVNTPEDYLLEIKAEDAMYRARDAYLKLGKADPYTEERQALREQEKQLQKDNMERLHAKTREYRQLEIELAKLQKMRAEKEEEIANAIKEGATQTILDELNADLREIDFKINNTKQALIETKEGLNRAMSVLEMRRARRRELSLETREYDAQSSREQSSIKRSQDKAAQSRNDYVQANKLETSTIRQEVARNEERCETLLQELKELKEKEPDNFEKRLGLLEQLDDASQQLKASKEMQKDMERGIEPDTDEAVKKNEKDYKTAEERKEDFVKQAEALIVAAKAQERAEGENAVTDTFGEKTENREATEMLAVGAALAIEGPNGDGIVTDVVEAEIIHEAISGEAEKLPPAPCTIGPLNNTELYNAIDPNTKEGREAAQKVIDMAKKAEKSAKQVEKQVQHEIEG